MSWYQSLFGTARSFDDYGFRQGAGGMRSWQDAFRPLPVPSYPEPPEDVRNFQDLDAETRKRNRNDMLLQVAAAIAEGSSSGHLGSALTRAAMNVSDSRRAAVAEENARRRGAWERDMGKVDREARLTEIRQVNQDREEEAKNLFEAWSQAQGAIDPRDRALYRRAATMAETGDLSGLQKLVAEAPVRKSLLDKGVNPDDELQVLLHRQRAVDEAQLEGRVSERKVLDPLDVQKATDIRKALSPLEIAQAEAEARARARHSREYGGGGRQLEGRLIQTEDGTWINVDQTIPGVVLDPRTGRPLEGKRSGETDLGLEAAKRALAKREEFEKLGPSEKSAWMQQNGGPPNLKRLAEKELRELREAYGAATPEGEGIPGDTFSTSTEPASLRSTAVVAKRVEMVERNLPNLRPDERQQAVQRITAGEPASRIIREKAFPGLPRNANGLDLWYEVEDDLRKGKSVAQIKQGLRTMGIAIP